MTAVTIQSNKIVLNEVKDNQELLETSYGKNERTLWQMQYIEYNRTNVRYRNYSSLWSLLFLYWFPAHEDKGVAWE